ncbi:MAG: glycosyltransferase family 92 protein [Opitutaceae bacterium]|jgi:hypothetical protein
MKRETRRELVACAALQNEGRYLREWIEFHKLAGFEHFYLYDLRSSDGTRRVAAEYAARGEATSIRWRDGLDAPVAAYNHCLDHYGSRAAWIAFLSLEDYLFGESEDDVRAVLSRCSAFSGVAARCVPFGLSLRYAEAGPLIERHDERANRVRKAHRLIVNLRFAPIRAITANYFLRTSARGRTVPVAAFQPAVACRDGGGPSRLPRLRVNHYLFKPVEKLLQGRLKRPAERAELIRAFTADHPHRGQCDLAAQRFLPRLRQSLGMRPAQEAEPLRIETRSVDRYACPKPQGPAPGRRGRAPREIAVLGMQRSGNHAFIQWLLSGLRGRWIFLNGVTVGLDPFESAEAGAWPGPGYGRYETALLRTPAGRRGFLGRLVFSLEEYPADVAGRWLRRSGPFLGTGADRVTILILRDPANLFASRLRKEGWGAAGSCGWIPFDRIHGRLARERWIGHALEFIGQTRHLPNLVAVDYARFVRSASYRAALAAGLGIRPDESVLARVPGRGGGSSFDGLRFDGRAGRMRILERWRHYSNDPLYRDLLADPRLRLLSGLIFGRTAD